LLHIDYKMPDDESQDRHPAFSFWFFCGGRRDACAFVNPAADTAASTVDLFLSPNDDRGDIRDVDGRIIIVSAGKLRQMNKFVAELFYSAANFLTRFHAKLDRLADVLLENALDRVARLQINFALGEKARVT
jgi:hypothetical protein